MNAEEINQRKREVVERFGPWTAHCIHLGDQAYTFDEPNVPQVDSRLRRYTQIAADITRKPLETLRVLDLACLEGLYGIEFALHGADVVAIEGREANLAKARFAKEILSIDNFNPILDDVRNLDKDIHGSFDVVLCLGILYHLDTPAVMNFVDSVCKVCSGIAIIDTWISPSADASFTWNGKTYQGIYVKEHSSDATPEEKNAAKWASLDNPQSFHLTRASLCNLLRHVGFSSVYECLNPYEYDNPRWPLKPEGNVYGEWLNRVTFVAIKGQRQKIISSPPTDTSAEIDRPENPLYLQETEHSDRSQGWRRRLVRLLGPLKAPLKRIIDGQ